MTHIIAYDIADPKRLQRVARRLERVAVRCQKSVFLFQGSPAAVDALLDELADLLKPADDVVQAWQLAAPQPLHGLVRGTPLPALPGAVVLTPGQRWLIDNPST